MFWLLEEKYSLAWRDEKKTFCARIESKSSDLRKRYVGHTDGGHPLRSFLSLSLQWTRVCPPTCQCHIARQTQGLRTVVSSLQLYLNCSHRNLTRLPEGIPANVYILDMSHNKVSTRTTRENHFSNLFLVE